MKRIILLLVALVLLAACGSTSTETAVEPAKPATAVPEEEAAAETESETVSGSVEVADIPNFPATSVQEASLVRDRDWAQGTDDPVVAIIEYGDFQ